VFLRIFYLSFIRQRAANNLLAMLCYEQFNKRSALADRVMLISFNNYLNYRLVQVEWGA
jgi:hypothetical protein